MDDDHGQVYLALAEAAHKGVPVALATVVETRGSMPRHAGSKMVIYEDGRIVGTVGGGAMESRVITEARAALADGQVRLHAYTLNSLDAGDAGVCGGTAHIFIEPVGLAPTLLVVGGGHVGLALASLGVWAGYRVVLSDDREAFCNPSYAPGLADYIVCAPADVPKHIIVGSQTYVAAVTRGLPVDLELLPALLQTPAPYIGLIGSRRRWALTAKALRARGIDEAALQRVRAPIGLELRAETPKEIAVSILAEVIAVRRGGTGQPMHWRAIEALASPDQPEDT